MSTRVMFADLASPATLPLVRLIAAQRGEVLDLYKVLLHSPAIAEGWLALLTAVRQKALLRQDLRELVILRIAHLNGASYEAAQHIPFARAAGLSEAQLAAVSMEHLDAIFDDEQRAVLAYCDAMTRKVQVADAVFGTVRRFFDDERLVELTATIAAYNMVSRFLEALAIHADA